MNVPGNVKVLFIAGFGPIVREPKVSRKFYEQALGITFEEEQGAYLHTRAGAKSFALWPLAQAAESCFGKKEWPAEYAEPSAWLEFDVEDVEKATEELEAQEYHVLLRNKKEPWGQVVTRLLSPEGLLVGVTFTPWMRESKS